MIELWPTLGRLAQTREPFVAYGYTRAGRDGVEALRDRRLALAQLWKFPFVLPRKDDLARRMGLQELALGGIATSLLKPAARRKTAAR